MLRLKRPADEGGESAAAVLLFTNGLQMLDPVYTRLDMTEHHCGARSQSELVCELHHFQPLVAVNFQRRNPFAHAINQNFAAAARNRTQPRILEFRDHLAQRHAESFREMLEFRRTKSVDVNVRISVPYVVQKIDVPVEWQFGMVATLHQDLNAPRGRKLVKLLIDLLERKDVMIFIFLRSIKRAELAVHVADVRIINVSIHNVSHDL